MLVEFFSTDCIIDILLDPKLVVRLRQYVEKGAFTNYIDKIKYVASW